MVGHHHQTPPHLRFCVYLILTIIADVTPPIPTPPPLPSGLTITTLAVLCTPFFLRPPPDARVSLLPAYLPVPALPCPPTPSFSSTMMIGSIITSQAGLTPLQHTLHFLNPLCVYNYPPPPPTPSFSSTMMIGNINSSGYLYQNHH